MGEAMFYLSASKKKCYHLWDLKRILVASIFFFPSSPLILSPANFLLFWIALFQWESQLIKLVLLLILVVSAIQLI